MKITGQLPWLVVRERMNFLSFPVLGSVWLKPAAQCVWFIDVSEPQ